MRSPIVIIACLKSRTVILPSWSESNTLSASIRSYNVSLSFPLSCTTFSRMSKVNYPEPFGSTLPYISVISVSVGFKLRARTSVPNSVVATAPRLFLSNKSKISLISFDTRLPAVNIKTQVSQTSKKLAHFKRIFFSFKQNRLKKVADDSYLVGTYMPCFKLLY